MSAHYMVNWLESQGFQKAGYEGAMWSKKDKDGGGIRPIICGERWRRCFAKKRCEHRRNDVNTVVMFFSVRTKKLPSRLLQERWLEAAGFAGFGIHALTMVEPKTGGSAF